MKQYFDAYEDELLHADEHNFTALLDKITALHTHIRAQVADNVPRIPLPHRFVYGEQAYTVPLRGRPSEMVLMELAHAFRGSVRWNQPTTLLNITPNPLLDTVAASTMAALHNINTAWDYAGGEVTRFEREVVSFLCHLAGWDAGTAEGLSTSGGKATLMYAIRCGINMCDRQSVTRGLNGRHIVFASAISHYSLEDICNYLGIGQANLVRIPVASDGTMRVDVLKQSLRRAIKAGKKVAAIVALGGDTLDHVIDPIEEICTIRDRLAKEYGLDYSPLVHVDSVNAWIALNFRDYDFDCNPLGIEPAASEKISTLYQRLAKVSFADSFSADFHKTGLAPYISSFFVVRQGTQLLSLNKREVLALKPTYHYGEVHTNHFSFENSRSAAGTLSAWTSIQRLGIEGYQRYWAQLIATGAYMRDVIKQNYPQDMRVVNGSALGHPCVVQLIPPGASYDFDDLLTDTEACESYSTYGFELYEYMAYGLLPKNDPYPLLGFIPAYKYEYVGIPRPAFLIYLNHPHMSESACEDLLRDIITMKRTFDDCYASRGIQPKAKRFSHMPK